MLNTLLVKFVEVDFFTTRQLDELPIGHLVEHGVAYTLLHGPKP